MDNYLVKHLLEESEKKSEEYKKKMKFGHKRDYSQFTINGIPMKVVFVRNVLPKWTEQRLSRLFAHYGPVQKVAVYQQPRPRKRKHALVSFKNSKDAEKALKQQFIDVGRYRMFVFPGYAVTQKKEKPEENGASSSGESSSQAAGEPLTEIDLSKGVPYAFPKDLLTQPLLKGMLQHSGAHLKKLNLQKAEIFGADALIETIASTCSELEDLRLESLYINDFKINQLKAFDKLKVLSLQECNPIKDFHLKWLLEKNNVLTHLEVTGSKYIEGTFLKYVKSPLQTLDLSYNGYLSPSYFLKYLKKFSSTIENFAISNCSHVEYEDVNNLLEKLPNLKSLTVGGYRSKETFLMFGIAELKQLEHLDLSGNENVCDSLLREIVENCTQLKSLNLSGSSVCEIVVDEEGFNIAGISALQNLRSLNVSSLTYFKGQVLRDYAENSPPIELLYLEGYPELTDEDIKCVLTHCHQLKHLDLTKCSKITEATIMAAVEVLNKRTNNQPLHLVVEGTKIMKPNSQQNAANGNASAAVSHPLLTIDYGDATKKVSNLHEDDSDDDIDDWTHLMYGTGKEIYYLLSDEDDSDFDGLNTSDFEDDSDDDEEKYSFDPRLRTYRGSSEECVLA